MVHPMVLYEFLIRCVLRLDVPSTSGTFRTKETIASTWCRPRRTSFKRPYPAPEHFTFQSPCRCLLPFVHATRLANALITNPLNCFFFPSSTSSYLPPLKNTQVPCHCSKLHSANLLLSGFHYLRTGLLAHCSLGSDLSPSISRLCCAILQSFAASRSLLHQITNHGLRR